MNCLVVIPRYINSKGEGYSFPLGICYISTALKQMEGLNVFTLNLNSLEDNYNEILVEYIIDKNIQAVFTGGLCLDFYIIKSIVDTVKKCNNSVLAVVGGGIITGDPKTAMKAFECVDYGIIGEGEKTVAELCCAIKGQIDIADVAGLIYKSKDDFDNNGDNYIITEPRKDISDLSKIGWPDYDGFDFSYYLETTTAASVMASKKNTVFMLTSRSCPYRCTFCFHTSGQIYRQRSLDDVFEELDYLKDKYNVEYIFFVDELFGISLERLKNFCDRIKKYSLKGWYSYFRIDHVDKEKVQLLKDAGCKCMFFGLESADNDILKSMNKKITIEKMEDILKLVYDEGMAFDGAFIFGDVAETYETSMKTLDWWYSHPEYKITLMPVSCYPGTAIYEYAVDKGIIADPVEFLKAGCPLINISKMNDAEYMDVMGKISDARTQLVCELEFVNNIEIDYKGHRISLESKCNNCNNVNYWKDHNMFMEAYYTCDFCGQKYNIPVINEMVVNAKKNLAAILAKHEKIALWGIGKTIERFLIELDVINNNNVFLIDRNEGLLQTKAVQSPANTINNQGIDFVVVCVPRYFGNIFDEAKNRYKITNIIDICQLCDPCFSLD